MVPERNAHRQRPNDRHHLNAPAEVSVTPPVDHTYGRVFALTVKPVAILLNTCTLFC